MGKAKITFIIAIIVCSISCKKERSCTVCNSEDPIKDIKWLAEEVEQYKIVHSFTLYKVILKEKNLNPFSKRIEGFYLYSGNVGFYYDCNHNPLCAEGGFAISKCEKYRVTYKELIYPK